MRMVARISSRSARILLAACLTVALASTWAPFEATSRSGSPNDGSSQIAAGATPPGAGEPGPSFSSRSPAPLPTSHPLSPTSTVSDGADPSAAASLPGSPAPVAAPVAGAGTIAASSTTVYRHGSRARRVVALTFDDGYSPTATLEILRILEAEHVPATFFPYGWAVRANPAVWRRVAADGYEIGNHTQAHRDLARLTYRQALEQLTTAQSTIERVTGRPMTTLFRPPYGSYTAATLRAAGAAGYDALVLWDVDTRDWSGVSSSTITARATAGGNGSIVLMHAGPAATPHALRAIIRSYRARGFDFVSLTELLHRGAPAVTPGQTPTPAPTPSGPPEPSATPTPFPLPSGAASPSPSPVSTVAPSASPLGVDRYLPHSRPHPDLA
jgi:peptidoglycan/xylan/chitin deacetylase (PgdA/CDA1 family)